MNDPKKIQRIRAIKGAGLMFGIGIGVGFFATYLTAGPRAYTSSPRSILAAVTLNSFSAAPADSYVTPYPSANPTTSSSPDPTAAPASSSYPYPTAAPAASSSPDPTAAPASSSYPYPTAAPAASSSPQHPAASPANGSVTPYPAASPANGSVTPYPAAAPAASSSPQYPAAAPIGTPPASSDPQGLAPSVPPGSSARANDPTLLAHYLNATTSIIQAESLPNGTVSGLLFSGKALALSPVDISVLPQAIPSVRVITDANGSWQYLTPSSLTYGNYSLTVSSLDGEGRPISIIKDFFIPKVQAASSLNGPRPVSQSPVKALPVSFLLLTSAFILLAGAQTVVTYRKQPSNNESTL
jgi:hypothetical protein